MYRCTGCGGRFRLTGEYWIGALKHFLDQEYRLLCGLMIKPSSAPKEMRRIWRELDR